MSKPLTNEQLAEMKALAEVDTWAVGFLITQARTALPRLIEEVERLKVELRGERTYIHQS